MLAHGHHSRPLELVMIDVSARSGEVSGNRETETLGLSETYIVGQ